MRKPQRNITDAKPSENIKWLIWIVNETKNTPPEKHGPPEEARAMRSICRIVHQMAQFAALKQPGDKEDYKKAVVGTAEEWERFCGRFQLSLWRDWLDIDPPPAIWTGPQISFPLTIDADGRWSQGETNMIKFLEGIKADRLRECRRCQNIFWRSRDQQNGGPFGCSDECNNTLRQRDHKRGKKP